MNAENIQFIDSMLSEINIFLKCATVMLQQMHFNMDCGHILRKGISFSIVLLMVGLITLITDCLYLFFLWRLFHLKLARMLHSEK